MEGERKGGGRKGERERLLLVTVTKSQSKEEPGNILAPFGLQVVEGGLPW
jgi:hypothetical protein